MVLPTSNLDFSMNKATRKELTLQNQGTQRTEAVLRLRREALKESQQENTAEQNQQELHEPEKELCELTQHLQIEETFDFSVKRGKSEVVLQVNSAACWADIDVGLLQQEFTKTSIYMVINILYYGIKYVFQIYCLINKKGNNRGTNEE